MTHAYIYPVSNYFTNLLGAAGLALSDAVDHALSEADVDAGLAPALVLLALRPGMSIGRLAERLRLSHPGAVRLADRLESTGLVERQAGDDRRVVRLRLTAAGRTAVRRVRAARGARLERIAASLSREEKARLQPLLETLLRQLTGTLVDAYANCRLCDTPVCEAHGCPVEAEARARFTPGTTPSKEKPDAPHDLR